MSDTLSVGQAAQHFGVPDWKVRRLFTRGLLPEPERFLGDRVIRRDDLPKVEQALRGAGYLTTPETTCEGSRA